MDISQAEQAKIRKAITKVEKNTSAEVFAVLTNQSDDYLYVASFFLTLWILIISVLLSLWMQWYSYQIPIAYVITAQLASFISGFLLLKLVPKLQIFIAPTKIKHRRARANGIKQFLAHGIHNTKGRTGILVFVSLQERYAEILVDTAIEEKVGRDFWLRRIEALIGQCKKQEVIEGIENTILQSQDTLAEHFPRGRKKLNELDDKLVII